MVYGVVNSKVWSALWGGNGSEPKAGHIDTFRECTTQDREPVFFAFYCPFERQYYWVDVGIPNGPKYATKEQVPHGTRSDIIAALHACRDRVIASTDEGSYDYKYIVRTRNSADCVEESINEYLPGLRDEAVDAGETLTPLAEGWL